MIACYSCEHFGIAGEERNPAGASGASGANGANDATATAPEERLFVASRMER